MTPDHPFAAPLIYGCMMLGGGFDDRPLGEAERRRAWAALDAAFACGIKFFDHADIYCHGKSEVVFGEWLRGRGHSRENLVIQSKCGIRLAGGGLPGRYDLSFDHLVGSVESSLRRLQTPYLDLLLLHRPDPLVEPEEVARAFDQLQREGKVRGFGVSNHSPAQIDLLRAHVAQPLLVNQLEYNPLHAVLHDAAIHANTRECGPPGEGTIEYCRQHGLRLQAWAALAKGRLSGGDEEGADSRVRAAAALVRDLAQGWDVPPEAVIVAWIRRHPADFQPVIGTTQPERIRAAQRGLELRFSREQWYALYTAASGRPVP